MSGSEVNLFLRVVEFANSTRLAKFAKKKKKNEIYGVYSKWSIVSSLIAMNYTQPYKMPQILCTEKELFSTPGIVLNYAQGPVS